MEATVKQGAGVGLLHVNALINLQFGLGGEGPLACVPCTKLLLLVDEIM